jgi:hypothetical protein
VSEVLDRLASLEVELGEIQESRKGRVQDWGRYEEDPVGWARDVLGFDSWARQEETLRSVADNPLTVVRGANGTGKDAVSFGPVALHHVFVRGGMVIGIAPTKRQADEIAMRELGRWWRAGNLPGDLFRSALRIEGDRGVLSFTSSEVSRLTGYHHPRLLVILTECQGLDPFVWEAALSCCVGDEDRILAVGNPLFNSGMFYNASRSENWNAIRMPASAHPNVREGRVVIPGGISRAGVERLAATYGRDSGTFKARVEAEFPDQGEESLFQRSWLEAAAGRWEEETLLMRAANAVPIVAVDPARYGPDSTALAVRRGPVITRIETWRGKSTMETVDRIVVELTAENIYPRWSRFGCRGKVIVDVVGIGSGVLDRLKEKGYDTVPYNGGAFTTQGERERFLNERAKSHWRLRQLLEDDQIALPRDEGLFDELMAVNWKPTADDKVQIEAKSKLKGALGRSPDKGDSVVIAFSGVEDAGVVRLTTYQM